MPSSKKKKIYDLEERTAKFGEGVIEFTKKVPKNVITIPLVSQLVRAGTSVGANYCEADCAESRKDFEHKLKNVIKKLEVDIKKQIDYVNEIMKLYPENKLFGIIKTLQSTQGFLNE